MIFSCVRGSCQASSGCCEDCLVERYPVIATGEKGISDLSGRSSENPCDGRCSHCANCSHIGPESNFGAGDRRIVLTICLQEEDVWVGGLPLSAHIHLSCLPCDRVNFPGWLFAKSLLVTERYGLHCAGVSFDSECQVVVFLEENL